MAEKPTTKKPTVKKAREVQPELVDMNVSFSFGTKVNLGNYESADVHISRSERWGVSGLTAEQVGEFYDERYSALQESVMTHANDEWTALKGS